MSFIEIMEGYFRGERIEALYYILPAGLLLIGLGATALFSDRGGFGWGLAVPLIGFGLVAVVAGLNVGLRTPGQVAELRSQYQAGPAVMLTDERPRMQAVNANWPRLVAAWTVLVLIGVGIRFGFRADWAQGLGPALILVGAIGFLIDGFAERRARPYTAALDQLAAEHPTAPAS